MQYGLSPGVHHAIADGRNIFLDVERDRYFALPESLDRAFSRYITNQQLDVQDRGALQRLMTQGLIEEERSSGHTETLESPGTRSVFDSYGYEPIDICKCTVAVLAIIAAKRFHRRSALANSLRRLGTYAVPHGDSGNLIELRRLAYAFRRATLLTKTRDECLPCSMALTICLRRSGIPARLVMGVSGRPFAAHCWVQVGDLIVNDTLDHVATFTPILVQ